MEVFVTGLSLISALGNLSQSWHFLLENKSGINLKQPFPELSPFPLALINDSPSNLKYLTKKLIQEALDDANLSPPLPTCGVVIGSSRSFQYQWENFAQDFLTTGNMTFPWLASLPSNPSTIAAQYLQTFGPVFAHTAACATGLWAIAKGYELIAMGECDRVVVGAIETPITPLTLAGFEKMGALASTGCYPFDKRREGLVLGEGGAILVLESAKSAFQRNAKIYGQVLGFGASCDAFHVTAPPLTQTSAIRAIKDCLRRSKLDLGQISYIHAHGTSTRLNDENEALIIRSLFPNVPVSSTKGATGHTLGASGAMGAIFCLMALQEQILPPNVGLRETDFALNFVRKATFSSVENTLCFAFGFGGQNVILALGKTINN